MIFSVRTAQILFATSLIAWGIQHFILGDFIAGRPPVWPEGLGGKLAMAYGSGLLLVAAGIAILINKKAVLTVAAAGALILLWAASRNLYELITKPDFGSILTRTNKALTISFGALMVASSMIARKGDSIDTDSSTEKILIQLEPLAKYFVGIFLLSGGIQHFIYADFVKLLIPSLIPGARFWTYFAGIALFAAGLGTITGIQRGLATTLSAWMIFVWIFALHLPRALGQPGNANEWTAVFEALATSALLFILANREKSRLANVKTNIL